MRENNLNKTIEQEYIRSNLINMKCSVILQPNQIVNLTNIRNILLPDLEKIASWLSQYSSQNINTVNELVEECRNKNSSAKYFIKIKENIESQYISGENSQNLGERLLGNRYLLDLIFPVSCEYSITKPIIIEKNTCKIYFDVPEKKNGYILTKISQKGKINIFGSKSVQSCEIIHKFLYDCFRIFRDEWIITLL
jgi:hypothetical protein